MKLETIGIGSNSHIDASKLPEYNRKAWTLAGNYGGVYYVTGLNASLDFVDKERRPMFAVVLHQHQYRFDDIKVEILLKKDEPDGIHYRYAPMDATWLAGVIATSNEDTFHVEIIDGRAYITGKRRPCDSHGPSKDTCVASWGLRFLFCHLNELATLCYWKDKIHTIPEAQEVNDSINAVARFKRELEKRENPNGDIAQLQKKLNDAMEDIKRMDEACCETHRKYEARKEYLKAFGIDWEHDNEKGN